MTLSGIFSGSVSHYPRMNRRSFLKTGTLASMAMPALMVASCQPGVNAPANSVSPEATSFPLHEFSITRLQEGMKAGEFSARALAESYLARIRQIDKDGPKINAVIEINPDALSIASALDDERRAGRLRGPLHGIPFLIKDNIDTADKMMTTAGSLALAHHQASEDAAVVRQLREAGAVLLGKTNLSEWANFRSSRSSSGWSSRGGQTRNPYVLGRNPCGSSSGSAVAVAANLCAFAIGTETNGSISCPSSVNGIVGLKPTVGLVSRSGIIPISRTQDTAGPMTRSVRDAAIVLSAITAVDENDEPVIQRPPMVPQDYTRFLDSSDTSGQPLEGKRIGIERSFLKLHEKIDVLLKEAIIQMQQAGATIVEVDFISQLKDIGPREYDLLKYEFKDGLNRYLERANGNVTSLQELIDFNTAHADSVMPYFTQDILIESQQMGPLNSDAYKETQRIVTTTARQAIDRTLSEDRLDALCGPATGVAWCTDLINGDAFSGYGMGSGAAMAGYPSITVPLGEVAGLPAGLLFLSSAYSEPDLLAIAENYERISAKRRSPNFLETVS